MDELLAHQIADELEWAGLEYLSILEVSRATLFCAQMGTFPPHKHLLVCGEIAIVSAFSILYFF